MVRRRKSRDIAAAASANRPQHIPAGPCVNMKALMPGHRSRHDGWNQQRLQLFIDTVAHSGCIEDAARVAGISATAARRAKRRFPLLSAVWDEALARAQHGLIAIAYQRAVEGRETVIIRKGEEFERRIQPSDSILGLLIKRGDMLGGVGAASGGDILTFDEWQRHIRFNRWGDKVQEPDPAVEAKELDERLLQMRKRLYHMAATGQYCPTCQQSLVGIDTSHSVAELVALGVVTLDEVFGEKEPERGP